METMAAELLKEYEDAKTRAEISFPGSVVAGPANYPIERHQKAWDRVHKLYDKYQSALQKETASAAHAARMARLAVQTSAVMGMTENPLVGAEIGSRLRLFWTNCGNQYSAIVEIVKINARTVKIKLVDNVPANYAVGQSWAVEKLKMTNGNRFEKI